MKCNLCDGEIEELILGKLKGTIVTIKEGDKNKKYYVCDSCQKKYKDLKKKLSEK